MSSTRSTLRVRLPEAALLLGLLTTLPGAQNVPADFHAGRVPWKTLPMPSSFHDLAAAVGRGVDPRAAGEALHLEVDGDGYLEIDVVGLAGGDPVESDLVQSFGGAVRLNWRHRTIVRLPARTLAAFARALPAGFSLQHVDQGDAAEANDDATDETGSKSYSAGGADGSGIKIAVLDNGFDKYPAPELLAAPPLSSIKGTYDVLDGGGAVFDDEKHGTGCLEQVYDHAPGADYYLVQMSSNATQLGPAVEQCKAWGVDVITMSLTMYNQGWADDSGDACLAVKEATDAGILFFVCAGNRARQHWRGGFVDTDGDGFHEFWPGASPAQSDETNQITVAAGSASDPTTIRAWLQWDDTSGESYDYDLLLYDESLQSELDAGEQSGGQFEYVEWSNSGSTSVEVKFLFKRKSGPATDLQLFVKAGGSVFEYYTAGSVSSPVNSTQPELIAVAALNVNTFTDPSSVAEPWSAKGPTNSGAIKPDITGPTFVDAWSYSSDGSTPGSFNGTSCAAPNVAGVAVALWSSAPDMSAAGIRHLLYAQARLLRDLGPAGKDNDHGWGGVSLHPFAPDTVWVDRSYGNAQGSPTGPYFYVADAVAAAPAFGRVLYLGGEYPESVTTTKLLFHDTVVAPATLGADGN